MCAAALREMERRRPTPATPTLEGSSFKVAELPEAAKSLEVAPAAITATGLIADDSTCCPRRRSPAVAPVEAKPVEATTPMPMFLLPEIDEPDAGLRG